MSAEVDIIIPVYNAAGTIRDTLVSIAEQTALSRLRLIVINDASTDGTLSVITRTLKEFPQLDRRTVLSSLPERSGPACAYNEGLKIVSSEWIGRCDADDTIPSDAVDRLLTYASNTMADIVCGAINVDNGRSRHVENPVILNGLNKIPLTTVNFSLCNKIFRRSLLYCAPDGRRLSDLPGINCWEDLSLTSRLMALPGCRMALLEGNPIYNYNRFAGAGSLTRSSREYILRQHMDCADQLTEWFRANCLDDIYHEFLMRLRFFAKVKMLRGAGAISRIKEWRHTYPETKSYIMDMKADMNLPLRIAFRLLSL